MAALHAGGRDISPSTATAAAPSQPLPRAGARQRLGPFGTAVQMFFGWGFTFFWALLAISVSLLTLGRFSAWLTPAFLRVWARIMLFIQRVELYVEGSEYAAGREMRVMVFNHSSLLDAMLVTAVQPTGGVPCIKREVLYIPLVGVALWALGFLLIDRGHTDRAKRLLSRATDRMAREKLTVVIAPEGTRSRDGELLPFKKGPFHIAIASRAPIVVMLIDGAHDLHPLGSPVTHPGIARVRFLPPIPTADLDPSDVAALSDRVRRAMVDGLADMRSGADG